MDQNLNDDQKMIRENVRRLCARFDDAYWLERDREGGYPRDFADALATDGWIGIAMPHSRLM